MKSGDVCRHVATVVESREMRNTVVIQSPVRRSFGSELRGNRPPRVFDIDNTRIVYVHAIKPEGRASEVVVDGLDGSVNDNAVKGPFLVVEDMHQ